MWIQNGQGAMLLTMPVPCMSTTWILRVGLRWASAQGRRLRPCAIEMLSVDFETGTYLKGCVFFLEGGWSVTLTGSCFPRLLWV